MKEVVYDLDEFKEKVSYGQPIHHTGMRRTLDKRGMFHELIFRIYGVSREGHIIIYEQIVKSSITEEKEWKKMFYEFEEKYAKPLGSTEGEWRE
jgi:hypothetical protein